MEGVVITDLAGRRLLSTHFSSPLTASLAVDAAIATTSAIAWLPSLKTEVSRSDSDEDEDDVEPDAWREARDKSAGGLAVVQIERRGLRYIAPVRTDVDPTVPLAFLSQLHDVLESYIGGPVTEPSLKDYFDTALSILGEMFSTASGLPLLTSSSSLRDLVPPNGALLVKYLGAAGLATSGSSSSTANALLSSPLPWRRAGIKYNSNEIYFDHVETLTYLLSPSGSSTSASKAISAKITGAVNVRSKVSGMPDLVLSFADPSLLQDVAFHPCVRFGKWRKEGIASFVPPDGAFQLLTYTLPPHPLPITLLPISITSNLTSGPIGGSFTLSLSARSSAPLSNLIIRIPLPDGASGVQASATGGMSGTGPGRWDVEEEGTSIIWRILNLTPVETTLRLAGTWQHSANGPSPPVPTAITCTFDSPNSSFSGVRIQGVKIVGGGLDPSGGSAGTNLYKGVKSSGKGAVEVRS